MNEAKGLWKNSPVELPEEEFSCPKHGPYRGKAVVLSFSEKTGANVKFSPSCLRCEEEAAVEREKQEKTARKERALQRLREMNIGEKFWHEDFETYNAYTPELVRHLETARKFAAKPVGKLVMLGNHGTGKNHLAAAIVKEVGGVVYTAYEIGLLLRQAYSGETREWEVLQKLTEAPLLVIDEVEKAKESEAKGQWLSYVVGKRYNNLLPIIFISNCHLQSDCRAPSKPCPLCMENHLGPDIISRILEDGHMMKFTGEDYRYKKRMAGLKAGGEAYA